MTSILFHIYLIFTFSLLSRAEQQYVDRKLAKCLVCQKLVEELYNEIMKVNPSLKYNVDGYAFDENKDRKVTVELRKSDVYLVEIMDNVCKRMDEYVRAFDKSTGLLEVIPLTVNGEMNTALNEYEIVKDGDLESLIFYCESIISEYEEELIKLFKASAKNIEHEICYSTEVCMNFNSDNPYIHNEL